MEIKTEHLSNGYSVEGLSTSFHRWASTNQKNDPTSLRLWKPICRMPLSGSPSWAWCRNDKPLAKLRKSWSEKVSRSNITPSGVWPIFWDTQCGVITSVTGWSGWFPRRSLHMPSVWCWVKPYARPGSPKQAESANCIPAYLCFWNSSPLYLSMSSTRLPFSPFRFFVPLLSLPKLSSELQRLGIEFRRISLYTF